MTLISHQTFRGIHVCKGCGVRAQCISKDGGFNFYCNRCAGKFGALRGHFYDDPKLAEAPEAPYDMYGEGKKQVKSEPETPKTEAEALKETEELIKQGLTPKQARGKVFNKNSVIIEEKNEKPTRNKKGKEKETS